MKFFKWLFGPSDFDKAVERSIQQKSIEVAETLYYEPRVKKYTMADGSSHFRASLADVRNVGLGDVVDECLIWQTNSRSMSHAIPGQLPAGCMLSQVARFGTYEEAKAVAENCAERYNAKLKRETVVKIESL